MYSKKEQGRISYIIFSIILLEFTAYGLIIPLLPSYTRSLGGSNQLAGVILGSFAFAQLFSTPILGKLSDKYGRRSVVLISLSGHCISMFLYAFATTAHFLIIARVLAGATAGNISSCQAIITDITNIENRTSGMGKIGSAIGLGMILGPLTGSFFSHWGVFVPPLVASFLILVDVFLVYFFLPETLPKTHVNNGLNDINLAISPDAKLPEKMKSKISFFSIPNIVPILLLFFFTFLPMSSINIFIPIVMTKRFFVSESLIGYAFALYGLIAFIIQGVILSFLTNTFGEKTLLRLGLVIFALSMVFLGNTSDISLFYVLLGLVSLGASVILPALTSTASKFATESNRGFLFGCTNAAGGLARSIGPFFYAYCFDIFDLNIAFYFAASFALLSLLLIINMSKKIMLN